MRALPKALIVVVVLATILLRFEQYEVEREYVVYSTAPCDQSEQSCFVWDCDIEDPDCDPTPYLKIEAPAHSLPECLTEASCEDFVCDESQNCSISQCSHDTLEEGEICATPDMLVAEGEVEEEVPSDTDAEVEDAIDAQLEAEAESI